MPRLLVAAIAVVLAAPLSGQATRPLPGFVRVRLDTAAGPIVLALDARHAPRTTANFLAYVDDGRLDGTDFYRASRSPSQPAQGFVQGGIGTDARRVLDHLPLETTAMTGLRHVDGALSMARGPTDDSGTCNFTILVGAKPNMDAKGSYKGYAVFGRVLAGMDAVKRMLAQPTFPGGDGPMRGQMLVRRVAIRHAHRLDGVPHPTGRPQAWLIGLPRS